MEGVAACQPAHVVIVFQRIEADGASVTGCGEHFRWRGSPDGVILIIIIRAYRVSALNVGHVGLAVVGATETRLLQARRTAIDRGSGFWPLLADGNSMILLRHFQISGRPCRVSGHATILRAYRACLVYHTRRSARRRGDAASSRQAFRLSCRSPRFIFGQWEAIIDFFHRHELLLPSSPVRPLHLHEVDGVAILVEHALAVALVVSEAIFDAYNDPEVGEHHTKAQRNEEQQW